jgi:CRISPR/Cas system-associated endonuclease Cas1
MEGVEFEAQKADYIGSRLRRLDRGEDSQSLMRLEAAEMYACWKGLDT